MILQKSFYADLMLKKHLLIISMLKTAVLLSMCYVLRKLIYIFLHFVRNILVLILVVAIVRRQEMSYNFGNEHSIVEPGSDASK